MAAMADPNSFVAVVKPPVDFSALPAAPDILLSSVVACFIGFESILKPKSAIDTDMNYLLPKFCASLAFFALCSRCLII